MSTPWVSAQAAAVVAAPAQAGGADAAAVEEKTEFDLMKSFKDKIPAIKVVSDNYRSWAQRGQRLVEKVLQLTVKDRS